MNKLVALVLFSLFTTGNAFALGETNCSNAAGTLKRVENEVWGANTVDYVYPDDSERIGAGTGDLKSLREAFSEVKSVVGPARPSRAWTGTRVYAARLTLTRIDGSQIATRNERSVRSVSDYVICEEVRTPGID